MIALGSQATVKEGLDKKTKEKVAVKVYDVRTPRRAPAHPPPPAEPALPRNMAMDLTRRSCCASACSCSGAPTRAW